MCILSYTYKKKLKEEKTHVNFFYKQVYIHSNTMSTQLQKLLLQLLHS